MDRAIEIITVIINIVLGLVVAYENFLFYRRTYRHNSWHWIKLAYAVIGIYWALIYSYKLFFPDTIPAQLWHYIFVRPAITLTLAAIASSAIMRMKLNKE